MFKCYKQVPGGASTNPKNLKKDNPVSLFWQAFLCKLVKNDCSDLIVILPPLNLHISTYSAII